MKSREVRRGHIFWGIALVLLIFLGCNASASVPTPPPATVVRTAVPPTPTRTPQPSRTPFPTRTPEPTPVPTQLPTPTVVPPIRIFDEALHPDWTLEFGDAPIQTLFTGATFGGFYAIEIRPNAPHQALLIALRQSSAKAYRAGAIQAISFQLYSGSQALNPNDLEVSIVGSRAFQYWSPDEVASLGAATNSFLSPYDAVFPPRTLAQLGITETVPPQTWVKVSYSLTQNNPTTTYDWLTGFYVENGSNFVSPYVIDDVRFLLTDE